jgi:hypothetical protein
VLLLGLVFWKVTSTDTQLNSIASLSGHRVLRLEPELGLYEDAGQNYVTTVGENRTHSPNGSGVHQVDQVSPRDQGFTKRTKFLHSGSRFHLRNLGFT